MRFPAFWPVTFYQTAKDTAKRSLGRGGRRGGGQFRRNVGQRNRAGVQKAQADTARHPSWLPASDLPAHLVSGIGHGRRPGRDGWKPRAAETGLVSGMGHRETSGRGGWKPRGRGAGLVSGMGSAGHYAGVKWKPTNQNEPAVSVILAEKIGECKESTYSLHSKRNLRAFGENIGCDCKENGNSLQSRIMGDWLLSRADREGWMETRSYNSPVCMNDRKVPTS